MKKIFIVFIMAACSASIYAADEFAMPYLEPEGTFFSGYNNKGSLLAPYMYMPGMSSYQFTSYSSGDWKMGETLLSNSTKFSPLYAFGTSTDNEIPSLTIDGDEYQYGKNSTTSGAKVVNVASGSFSYMTNAKMFASGSSVATVLKIKSYSAIQVFFYNKPGQIMRVAEVSIPITTNNSSMTKDDLFSANSSMSMRLYKAEYTRNSNTGKYTKSKIDTPLTEEITISIDDYTPISDSKTYVGSINVALPETLAIEGPFMVELYNYSTMGDECRIYGDKSIGSNTSLVKTDNSVVGLNTNLAVSVRAMFPSIIKADNSIEQIDFTSQGGSQQIAINSNGTISSKQITKPDWVTCDVSFESDKQYTNKLVYLTFKVNENESISARAGEIVINNNGMSISYTIKQAGAPAINLMTEDGENVAGWVNFGTKTLAEEGSENYTGSRNYSLQVLNFAENATVSVGVENDEVDAFTASYDATSELVTVSYDVLSTASGAYKSQLSVKVTDKDNNEYQTTFPISLDVNATGETTALENIEGLDRNAPMYNVLGMQVDANYKGIVIQEGKKFMLQ